MFSVQFTEMWQLWADHRNEIGYPLTASALKVQMAMLQKAGMEESIEIIARSINSGWRGLFRIPGFVKPKSMSRDEADRLLKDDQQDPGAPCSGNPGTGY
jgi:hypothetical protein